MHADHVVSLWSIKNEVRRTVSVAKLSDVSNFGFSRLDRYCE
jgi:hypothetical protein